MQKKVIFFLTVSILIITSASCGRINDNEEEKITSTIVVSDTVRTYYKAGELKEEFFIDKSNLMQGKYRLYYENGVLKELRNFYNDSLIGFYKFYDENGQITKMQSQLYTDDGKLGVGESILFKYDSLGNQSARALTFATTIKDDDNGVLISFDPYFSYTYDSIVVDIIYRGCNLKNIKKSLVYGTFLLDINTKNACNDVLIKFELLKRDKAGNKLIRNLERVYPISEGKLISEPWDNK